MGRAIAVQGHALDDRCVEIAFLLKRVAQVFKVAADSKTQGARKLEFETHDAGDKSVIHVFEVGEDRAELPRPTKNRIDALVAPIRQIGISLAPRSGPAWQSSRHQRQAAMRMLALALAENDLAPARLP